MSEKVTVYFDYLCPFAWRAAEVTEQVREVLGLTFDWHHFSLYQNNYAGGNGWQLWNEKIDLADEAGTKGLLPFLASCAARRQGEGKFDAFRLAVMRKRHVDCAALTTPVLMETAEQVGLHMPQFEADLKNPECRTLLARDHHRAEALDVFGTPTFQFESGHIAYLRIAQLPQTAEESVQLFSDYRNMLETYPYLETIKRPRKKRN